MGVDWMLRGQQGRRRKLLYILPVLLPSLSPVFRAWRGTVTYQLLYISHPKSSSIVSVPKLLSSHTATHHPTHTDSLIRGHKEIEKGFSLVAGCKNTTTKLNHFLSYSRPACLPMCYLSLSSPPLFPMPIQVLTLLAENCSIWFDRYAVLEALARLAIVIARVLASFNTAGTCLIYLPIC